MAKCDLCNARCGADKLRQLIESYQVADVVDVCPSCEGWANKLKGDMLLEIGPRMRAAIAERKGTPQPDPWWRRLLAPSGSLR